MVELACRPVFILGDLMKIVPTVALFAFIVLSGCGSLPGFSPGDIWEAAAKDDTAAIKEFMDEGVGVNTMDDAGSTPLHAAARAGATEAIVFLCGRGADPNAFNKDGYTPLQIAVTSEQREAVIALLNSGANINIRSQSGKTALRFAIDYEAKEIADDLRERGGVQ